jgi:hypothetical protein
MGRFLRLAWQRWKWLAERLGHFQARFLFALLYLIVVAPFGIAVRIFSDPLGLKKRPLTPNWRALARQTTTLEDAHRQF